MPVRLSKGICACFTVQVGWQVGNRLHDETTRNRLRCHGSRPRVFDPRVNETDIQFESTRDYQINAPPTPAYLPYANLCYQEALDANLNRQKEDAASFFCQSSFDRVVMVAQ